MLYSVDFCYHGYRNVIYLTELTSVKIIYNKEKNYHAMIYENNYFDKIFFFLYINMIQNLLFKTDKVK